MIRAEQITTFSLDRSSRGSDICKILAAAINGADPGEAVRRHVSIDNEYLLIDCNPIDLHKFSRIYILGAGKASIPMATAIGDILGDHITSGFIVTKEGYLDPERYGMGTPFEVIEASHPIPDQRNIVVADKFLSFISNIKYDDLVIFVLSGGGSSLLTKPSSGLTLQDIQITTSLLLSCGATISEINTIRKHLDDFKGGGIAKLLAPAVVITLIYSDVIGDDLGVIASGPTVADPSTFSDALVILEKYNILGQIPHRVRNRFTSGVLGEIPETIKSGNPILAQVTNIIVGNINDAINSAFNTALMLGFNSKLLTSAFQGEASAIGSSLSIEAIKLLSPPALFSKPVCLIAGGESTVTVRGTGKGGRNQELALGAVNSLTGPQQWLLASLATDGGDGPTDAAGAVVTNETLSRALSIGLDPQDHLTRNDFIIFLNA